VLDKAVELDETHEDYV